MSYEVIEKILCCNCGSDTELLRIHSDHEEIVCRECLDKYEANEEDDEHDPDMHEVDYAWDWDGK